MREKASDHHQVDMRIAILKVQKTDETEVPVLKIPLTP
jgi:Protein kinase domain